MRIGYSYWGFLGDHKVEGGQHVSTPDGNAAYSWSIIWELLQRDFTVYNMQKDRDHEGWLKYGRDLFSSFSEQKRTEAYIGLERTHGESLPELDVLLVEWRFPIPGRNCLADFSFPQMNEKGELREGDTLFQPDLHRQYELLEYYKGRGTKIILWDLDHKLDGADELVWEPDAIFETSKRPRMVLKRRTSVEFPTIVADLMQHPTLPAQEDRKLVYIGSRYERDEVITKWLKPTSDSFPQQVEFWGNWMRTVEECKKLWPNVSYHDRITMSDFREVYGTAVACPILAKQSYLETGFITPRPWEALMFGTIPVGLGSHLGISDYVQPGLIAGDGWDMIEVVKTLTGLPLKERDRIRRENVEQIEHMDARYFVDRIEDVANEVVDMGEDLRIEKEGA